jgi:hypothetical protein
LISPKIERLPSFQPCRLRQKPSNCHPFDLFAFVKNRVIAIPLTSLPLLKIKRLPSLRALHLCQKSSNCHPFDLFAFVKNEAIAIPSSSLPLSKIKQ